MRLTRLVLARYGHLTDVELTFPANPALHIVLGANETGKSTALAAIGDCLFGFPHRTLFDFLHDSRNLRVGATLRAQDGREASFVRYKRRKDDLTDAQDRPLPESAIAAFLSGATRERFQRVFGLNGADLRTGGDAILQGEGEVGAAILGAHTGLRGFRALVDRLDAEAGRLFGDKRGKRAFHEAVDRFTQARGDIDQSQVNPADYKQKQADLASLEQARADNAVRSHALQAQRGRLDRIWRTTPARLALARDHAALADLGCVADLPADAAQRCQDAVSQREQALDGLRREHAQIAEKQAELESLPAAPPILAEAEAIDALAALRRHIANTEADRVTQNLRARQHAAVIVDDGARLGLALDADTIVGRIPTTLDRAQVGKALKQRDQLVGQRITRADALDAAKVKRDDAQAALDALPAAEPAVDLRQAIEVVQREGRLDAQLREATQARQVADAALAQALAALPLWDRDAATLAAAPVPLDAIVQRHTEALQLRRDALQRVDQRLEQHDRALLELVAEITADEAGGDLPTRQAIQAARDRRDLAWNLIRRRYLKGGRPPDMTGGPSPDMASGPTTEVAELVAADDSGLAEQLEALMGAADRVADRRADEQERVVAAEQRLAARLRRQVLRDADERERTAAAGALEAAVADWRAAWRPVGVEPVEPVAMREWTQRRLDVLLRHQAAEDAAHKLADARRRHASALATLAALRPRQAAETGDDLAELTRFAERTCRSQEQQAERRDKARSTLEMADADLRKAGQALARSDEQMAAWQAAWAVVAPLLGLLEDAEADLAAPALTLWESVDAAARVRREALDRVDEMTVAIDKFAADTAAVVGRIGPDLAGAAPLDAVSCLAARLDRSRQAAIRRQQVADDLLRLQQAARHHEQARDAAEGALAGLRAMAGVTEDAALLTAISRTTAHRLLSERIATREAELRGLDEGKSLAELAAEAEGVEIDALPARISETQNDLNYIGLDNEAGLARVTELKAELAAMEKGNDAAGAAQAKEVALADIDDITGRYVTLRLAHTLLRAGIDRFSRQQQDPLLNRAGQIFGRLTEDRYNRLDVDHRRQLLAIRPDASECPAERLSEGTRDQLYLALRLAAIESYARSTEPLPFVGDDLLVNFDDRRATAALRVLAEFGKVTQVILFTHHGHIADMAEAGATSVHRLSAQPLAVPVA